MPESPEQAVGAAQVLMEVRPAVLPRPALVGNNRDYSWISDKICGIAEERTPAWWWWCFAAAAFVASFTVAGLTYLVATGVGVWGHRSPVNWAWDIVNFVFWIGIGHAGTLISAILCLLRQKWRTSINRSAEAMTIFAVFCAAIYPLFHLGRIWYSWFLVPVPNSNEVWQNYRSPLEWDVFAIATYGTVSVLFWYVGMIPDLATMRDRFTSAGRSLRARIYGLLAMGWRGSNRHWSNYEMAYLILAGIATPLVLSVHTIVSYDFAVSLIPGWHTTIFPPYFVAGAIFSGFGMVLTLVLPLRAIYGLEDLVTQHHIDCMCKITLATGTMVGYAYLVEFFVVWYSADPFEGFGFINRAFGPYWWAYWVMIACCVVTPQLFWSARVRRNTVLVFILSLLVNLGMWFERFVIIAASLARDFLPTSWGYYSPSVVEIFTFFGTFGVFSVLFLLFIRFLPIMAVAELKAALPSAGPCARRGGPSPSPVRARRNYGLIAAFDGPGEVLRGAERVRDAGYKRWDCITPFPVHGLDAAMGVGRSRVPRISLAGGVVGFCAGMVMIWYLDKFDYALSVGGKPFFSPLFAFPVSYELSILFAAFTTIGGMFLLNGLPKHYHPVLKYERIRRGTDDLFFIVIERADPRYDSAGTRALLEGLGGSKIAELER